MIDLARFVETLRTQADGYGDKIVAENEGDIYPNEMRIMYGTACLVLYAVVISLHDAIIVSDGDPVQYKDIKRENYEPTFTAKQEGGE